MASDDLTLADPGADGLAEVPVSEAPELDMARRREARLEQLRELGDDVTVSMRAHRAKLLCEAHEILLGHGERQRATELFAELTAVVGDPPADEHVAGPDRELWFWFAWSIAVELVDAIGRAEHARAEVLFLRQRAAAMVVGDDPRFGEIWATSLEAGHAAAIARGRRSAANERLATLRELVAAHDELGIHLARALERAHASALDDHDRRRAGDLLDELRVQANHGWALAYERVALSRALRRSHPLAGPQDVEAILLEAAALTNRHDATEELRTDLAAMLVPSSGEPASAMELPDVALRERAHADAATSDDVRAMIDRLVRELADEHTSYLDGLGRLHEIRTLLARDDADPQQRIRFAELWFGWVPPALGQPQASELAARKWARAAARAGDARGDVLLGHCHRRARGVPRNLMRARAYYRRAHLRGSGEAEYWLRRLVVHDSWRIRSDPYLVPAGLGLLALHAFAVGPDPTPLGVAMACGVLVGFAGLVWVVATLMSDERESGDAWVGQHVMSRLRVRPGRLLFVAGEDGLALVPCALVGVTPWTAALAGIVFGALHYPTWSVIGCLGRGFAYALAVVLVGPQHGLWSLPIAHVLYDALLVGIDAIARYSASRSAFSRGSSNR